MKLLEPNLKSKKKITKNPLGYALVQCLVIVVLRYYNTNHT